MMTAIAKGLSDFLEDDFLVGLSIMDNDRLVTERAYDTLDDVFMAMLIHSQSGHFSNGKSHLAPAVFHWMRNEDMMKSEYGLVLPPEVKRAAVAYQNEKPMWKRDALYKLWDRIPEGFEIDIANIGPRDLAGILHRKGVLRETPEELMAINAGLLRQAELYIEKLLDSRLPLSPVDEQGLPLFHYPSSNDPRFEIRNEQERMRAIAGLVWGLTYDTSDARIRMVEEYGSDPTVALGTGQCLPVIRSDFENGWSLKTLERLDAWMYMVNQLKISKYDVGNERGVPDPRKVHDVFVNEVMPKMELPASSRKHRAAYGRCGARLCQSHIRKRH
jgi:hypothetical protein